MWELLLSLVLIYVLYAKTINYANCIDDGVKIEDTLYSVPTTTPPPIFFTQKSPLGFRIRAIGIHMLNTCLVYLILGGHAALLFSVYPISVNNVAWITGSYYSIATFFTLIAYYFITHTPWFISIPVAMTFFGVALNATLVTISFPFLFFLSNPIGLCTLIPLGFFLLGKRFTTGLKIRGEFTKPAQAFSDTFTLGRLVVCTKVVAYYLYLALVPIKLVFFHAFGNRFLFDKKQREDLFAMNKMFFASVALIGAFLLTAFVLHKIFWAMWFLVLIAAFSQYKSLGQFFAERYMYPATIGIIALLTSLPEPVFWGLFGMYIVRSYVFIPAFSCNGTLYENGTYWEPLEAANYCNLSDWHLLVEPDLSLAGYYAQTAIKFDSSDFKPHVNMSTLFMILKQYPCALKEIKTAILKADGNQQEEFMKIMLGQVTRIEELMGAQKQQADAI